MKTVLTNCTVVDCTGKEPMKDMLAEGRIGAGLSETSVKCGSTAVEDSGWRSILCVLSEGTELRQRRLLA